MLDVAIGLMIGVIVISTVLLYFLNKVAHTGERIAKKLDEAKLKPPTCPHAWEITTEKTIENNDEKKLVLIQKCTICGALDKTVESLKKDRPKSECRHKWVKQKSVNIDSAYEQYAGEMKNATKDWRDTAKAWLAARSVGPWAFRKTYVCTYICDLCGEINTVIASNYDLEDVKDVKEDDENSN